MKAGMAVAMMLILAGCKDTGKKVASVDPTPKIVGAMKNVMRKGELFATINIDTIADKKHLYGLGPVEYLAGELMIIDGKCYKAVMVNDTGMQVTESLDVKAPFFGYANIEQWEEVPMPDTVLTLAQLETFLNETAKNRPRPFFFRLTAAVDSADIHVVNLPRGAKVSSPEDARQGRRNYGIVNTGAEMVGFFSTEHQTIFTHHDTYVHIHLMTDDKKRMGHLEGMHLKKGTAKLYLPVCESRKS
jgi:acetolactate decarboxylase